MLTCGLIGTRIIESATYCYKIILPIPMYLNNRQKPPIDVIIWLLLSLLCRPQVISFFIKMSSFSKLIWFCFVLTNTFSLSLIVKENKNNKNNNNNNSNNNNKKNTFPQSNKKTLVKKQNGWSSFASFSRLLPKTSLITKTSSKSSNVKKNQMIVGFENWFSSVNWLSCVILIYP